MVNQIYASQSGIHQVYSGNLVSDSYYVSYFTQFFVQLFISIIAIWYLDFFRSWYGYFCIYPDLKYRKYLCLSMLLVSTHYSSYCSPSSRSSYMIICLALEAISQMFSCVCTARKVEVHNLHTSCEMNSVRKIFQGLGNWVYFLAVSKIVHKNHT